MRGNKKRKGLERTRESLNNNLRCPPRNGSLSLGFVNERFGPFGETFRESPSCLRVAYRDPLSQSERGTGRIEYCLPF